MEEIGQFLKENRINQNLTITDISNITKMNINIIRNIEEGNVAYFSNDFTYLKYYIKAYSDAVNVDFKSLEETLNKEMLEYTQSVETIKEEKINKLNQNINQKKSKMSSPLHKSQKKIGAGSIDWTLISLISIVILIAGFLIYSVYINFSDKTPTEDNTPPVVEEGPKDEEDNKGEEDNKDDEQEEEIIAPVEINKEDPNTYLISNWQNQEEFSIKTKFAANTWLQIQVNDQVINVPETDASSKTFSSGEELVISDKYTVNGEEKQFKANDVINIRYGIMRGNEFFINNEEYALDEEIANANNPENVIFKLDADVD